VKEADERHISNLKLLTALKTMPETLGELCRASARDISVPGTASISPKARTLCPPLKEISTNLSMYAVGVTQKEEKETIFVLAAVGFETTAPVWATVVKEADERHISNLKLLTALTLSLIDGKDKPSHSAEEKIGSKSANDHGFTICF